MPCLECNPQTPRFPDAFYIDKYEVTNALFQKFVQATHYRTQAERDGGLVYTGKEGNKSGGNLADTTWEGQQP